MPGASADIGGSVSEERLVLPDQLRYNGPFYRTPWDWVAATHFGRRIIIVIIAMMMMVMMTMMAMYMRKVRFPPHVLELSLGVL